MATTSVGYTCQSWDSQYPHSHSYTPIKYRHSNLTLNYCRNPGGSRERPWCYTTSTSQTWGYCNLPLCSSPPIRNNSIYPLGSKL